MFGVRTGLSIMASITECLASKCVASQAASQQHVRRRL